MPRDGAIVFGDLIGKLERTVDQRAMSFISRGLVSAGFASRKTLTSRLISRQVTSSVYVGEKVIDFTQPTRSSAGNVVHFLFNSSRVRCSLARQLCAISRGVPVNPSEAAVRQLEDKSQFGTPSATAVRVRRAKASVGQNEMPSAAAAAMAIVNRRNMTISRIACNLSLHCEPNQIPAL
jgi:hypothetical protein